MDKKLFIVLNSKERTRRTASIHTSIGLKCHVDLYKQESRAVAGNPRDAAVIFDP